MTRFIKYINHLPYTYCDPAINSKMFAAVIPINPSADFDIKGTCETFDGYLIIDGTIKGSTGMRIVFVETQINKAKEIDWSEIKEIAEMAVSRKTNINIVIRIDANGNKEIEFNLT